MKKKERKPKPPKQPFRLRFLTVLMLLAIAAAAVTGGVYIHTIAGKGTAFSEKEKAAENEKEALEAERKTQENARDEKEESGRFYYDPTDTEGNLDYVIADEDDAYDLLLELQYDLGITDAEKEYKYSYSTSSDYYDVYTMQQYYDGVEVYGAELKMTADKSGNLTAINGKYESVSGISTDAALSESDARDCVEKYLKSEYQYDPDDLEINGLGKKIRPQDTGSPVLAYQFEVLGRSAELIFKRIFVDANTGVIVSDYDLIKSEMITLNSDDAGSAYKKPQGQQVVQTLDVWRASDTSYELRDTERGFEVGYLADPDVVDVSVIEWDPSSEAPDPSGVDALANLQRAYDYYLNVHGQGGITDGNSALKVIVGLDLDGFMDNAFMYQTELMLIGARSDASKPEFSVDLNVISHEYTHGVTHRISNLYDGESNETDSIGEALADIFAELTEDYWDDGSFNNSCDWLLGQEHIRDIPDPSNSAESGEHLTDAKDFVEGVTDEHNGSTIISQPAYLMSIGINNKNEKKIDTRTLGNLWYTAIQDMSASTDFAEVRKIVERKAADLNNANSSQMSDDQLECVLDAFDRTGIPHSYDYALTPESTLKVYDQNNELYDNYRITVNKFGGEEVLSKEVKKTSYKLKLSAGIYSVKLTDLENEELTETFTLIVNDNDSKDKVEDYKKSENIYTKFGSDERQVALVLDVSGSMSGTPISETKKAAVKFVNSVLKESPNTKISIVTYSSSASTVMDATSKKSKLRGAINGLGTGGQTNMYDAMDIAKGILEEKKAEKKMMVVMSDGLPNAGTSDGGDYNAAVVSLADEIKSENITIYSLGFFHNLSGSELTSGTNLMAQIASSGYHYNVSNTEDIQYVFEGMAYDVNGNNYILIRIACPVDVTVSYSGETLSSAEDTRNISAGFGMLSFEGEEDETKILRLKEGDDYEICINGTGKGTMDYSIGFADEDGEYTDERTFHDVPINRKTVIATNTSNKGYTVLNVDTDGNGTFDLKYIAGKDKEGKTLNQVILQMLPIAAVILLILFCVIEVLLIVSRYKKNKVCPSCGWPTEKKIQFCQNCGSPIYRRNLILPDRRGHKKQPIWIRNVKLIVICCCLVFCAGITLLSRSAATTVFKQVKSQQLVSAQMLYENGVADSKAAKKYLSALTEHYLDQVQTGWLEEKISEKSAQEIYQTVAEMEMGNASETAEEYLEMMKVLKKAE